MLDTVHKGIIASCMIALAVNVVVGVLLLLDIRNSLAVIASPPSAVLYYSEEPADAR